MTNKTIEYYQEELDIANARIDKAIEFIEDNSEDCTEVLEHVTNILLHWLPNVEWNDEEIVED